MCLGLLMLFAPWLTSSTAEAIDALEKMMESVRGEIKALDKKVTHIKGRLEGTESSALKTSSRVSELERHSQAVEFAAPRSESNKGGGCAGTSNQRMPGDSTGGKDEAP